MSLALLALVGCSSGQTGSPECVGGTSCVCEPVHAGGALLRVRVERFDGWLQASVGAVVSPAEHAFGLVANEPIAGEVLQERPCERLGGSVLVTGEEALVLYQPRGSDAVPICEGAQATEECRSRRSQALLDGVFSWAVPWTEPLDFGADQGLATTELSVLLTPDSCFAHFHETPTPPCDDVRSGCSASRAPVARDAWFSALAASLLLVAARGLGRRGSRGKSANSS